jgi:hypothetical protein
MANVRVFHYFFTDRFRRSNFFVSFLLCVSFCFLYTTSSLNSSDYGDPSESRVSAKRGASNASKKKSSNAKAAPAPVVSPAPAAKKAAGSGSGSGGKLILGSGSKITLGGSGKLVLGGAKAAESASAGMRSFMCVRIASMSVLCF